MGAFWNEIKWPKWRKSDWLALALAGAILLIVAWPIDKGKKDNSQEEVAHTQIEESSTTNDTKDYVTNLEEKLEKVLGQMEGVGKVKVMITLSDYGEMVVEKDLRKTTNEETQEETVYVKKSSDTYPYVEKEILPSIEGILVVAEGGGNAAVVTNISNAAMALFRVEAHKIMVVKMNSKGD